jgi:ubiquinone/menaquinone biosynthesis C-methylase UbiE
LFEAKIFFKTNFSIFMKKECAIKIINNLENNYDLLADDFSNSRKETWKEIDFLFDDYLCNGDNVLDLGCGNGRFYPTINQKAKYTGVDKSKRLIDIAQEKYPDASFFVGDALSLNFSNERFDKVYSIALFHHIPSQKLRKVFLDEIKRVLKPGGLAIITVWCLWEKPSRKKEVIKQSLLRLINFSKLELNDVLIEWQGSRKFYFHSFSVRRLARKVKKSGFKIIKKGKASSSNGTNIFIVAEK